MKTFIRTLCDIGILRLQRRVRYTLRQHIDSRLPPSFAFYLASYGTTPVEWRPSDVHYLANLPLPPSCHLSRSDSLSFTFLSSTRALKWPIPWDHHSWERLWKFNLHYFDWSRTWLDQALSTGSWPTEASWLPSLIDHWIDDNPPGRGDGWHSYTSSLRIRNWIWLFRCCPQLASPERLSSLWNQLLWLQAHPEYCHGGNHWLENLIALSIGGLHFEGYAARCMHERALLLLKSELESQILHDGGHEERSASYHLLLLDRLVELACTLESITGHRPAWLVQVISSMSSWARSVRLQGGMFPRFNDSAPDAAPPLDQVVDFAEVFLQRKSPLPFCISTAHDLRYRLLDRASVFFSSAPPTPLPPVQLKSAITDLPSTGWTILRPGHHWEVLFKCGTPCPDHLPAHVHSDQLSVELVHRGRWLIAEAGTSVYGTGPVRAYERSGAAHNVLQLGHSSAQGSIHWVEPVDVWHGFRAGRKAHPRHRRSGTLTSSIGYAEGSHDGFDRLGAQHHRRVELLSISADLLNLQVLDTITTKRSVHFRLWWHLGPELPDGANDFFRCEAASAQNVEELWHDTWFSLGFGQRVSRRSYSLQGLLPPGQHRLQTIFQLSASLCPVSG